MSGRAVALAAPSPTLPPPASSSPVLSSPVIASDEAQGAYKLGDADKVRVIVFNEPTLSGEFTVNAGGSISVPLVGEVAATGRTTTELQADIEQKLRAGYLRDPHVSIDVLTFRPFYILGEVTSPGQYPYSAKLTVMNAVATAKGFTYRADKRRVYIKHPGGAEQAVPLTAGVLVAPGDTIRIGERYF